ncbi:Cadherin-related family member 4, partial [Eschrichtius robustus]|nr:Cadherin-related family member 4 [Eschrichtius robustus]
MSITSAQDPPYFPGPFSINGQGWLQAPSQGLKGQAQKVFQLQILVTFGQGRSCCGTLTVKVLPAPSSQVSFLQQAQNITIPENLVPGSKVVQVQARGFNVRYEILSPVPCRLFSIGRVDGVVRTTSPLELAQAPDAAVTRLRVKAFERLRPWASAELDFRVDVQSVNRWPPRCTPALLVTQIPETTPVGTVLNTFTCTDPDSPGSTLDYQLLFHSPAGAASLCLQDRVLEVPSPRPQTHVQSAWTGSGVGQWSAGAETMRVKEMVVEPTCFTVWKTEGQGRLSVNATLDCDTPGACFHHAASILVLDSGQPLMTREGYCPSSFQSLYLLKLPGQGWATQASSLTAKWLPAEVPVLVMVTPVNEFSPACVPRTFRVREDAGPHALLGSVVGKDMDYPHDSIEYSTPGGSATFAVDRLSGEVRLLGPLDYELQKLHRLTVLLTDHSQDQDPTCHRSGSCTITIEVEDVNDHAPECEPPFQELTIHTHLGRSMEVTRVSCQVPQEPQRLAFSYSIVGGNSRSQFSLQGAVLVHNDLMLGPSWPEQPHTYELLIRVADAGPSTPHLSTTATVIVTSMMTPLLVTDTEAFWQPEPWFVVVLTVTSALLLLALGWLLSRLLRGLAQLLQAPSKSTQALLLNSIQGTEGSVERFMEAPRMETPQAPSSVMSLPVFANHLGNQI